MNSVDKDFLDNLKQIQKCIDHAEKVNSRKNKYFYGRSFDTSSFLERIKAKIKYFLYKAFEPVFDYQAEYNQAILDTIKKCLVNYCHANNVYSDELLKTNFELLQDFNNSCGPRIIQEVPFLGYGDAIGNDVSLTHRYLKENGYNCAVFTSGCSPRVTIDEVFYLDELPELREDDLVIVHYGYYDPLIENVIKTKAKVVLRYHNITPPHFYEQYDKKVANQLGAALKQVRKIKDYVDYAIADSEFNKHDLIEMGYTCPIGVVPVFIPLNDYQEAKSVDSILRLKDGTTNLVFVGRIAPNKCIEDVIESYLAYKNKYDTKARLYLVGNYKPEEKYYKKLKAMIDERNIDGVIFTGHISFDEIVSYYKIGSAFICMSEHEGFGVPLIEAMLFNIPLIAYNSSAVPYTMEQGGLLIKEKDYNRIADDIYYILTDDREREVLLAKEEERLKFFDYQNVGNELLGIIKKFME